MLIYLPSTVDTFPRTPWTQILLPMTICDGWRRHYRICWTECSLEAALWIIVVCRMEGIGALSIYSVFKTETQWCCRHENMPHFTGSHRGNELDEAILNFGFFNEKSIPEIHWLRNWWFLVICAKYQLSRKPLGIQNIFLWTALSLWKWCSVLFVFSLQFVQLSLYLVCRFILCAMWCSSKEFEQIIE